jgi:manganese transport protein
MKSTSSDSHRDTENKLLSLADVNQSIDVPTGSGWKRWLAFIGPGFLVSVGYMDPGNWGTDLAAGSKYGYALLWVVFVSNLIAQFLQVLCARLGLVTGNDLAMACRDYYRRPVAIVLWFLCEIAIIACDLAEVVGSAVALNLLFKIPLEIGILITGLDVLLLLGFMKFGFRKIEAIVITLVATIFFCFAFEIMIAQPNWPSALRGTFLPTIPGPDALLIALGILGATVMPHNLYLHSSIVQTRKKGKNPDDLQRSIKVNTIETVVALSLAFFVNAAILILAASVFGKSGIVVEQLQDGHRLLSASLGGASATVFAVALLASGQSSTITGTLAGQIVMEGFMNWKVKPWARRLISRGLAIVPAILIIHLSGGTHTISLLINSQVVLSLQLPFAIFPLIAITSDQSKMGQFVNTPMVRAVGYTICGAISVLNVFLIVQSFAGK